MNIYQSYTYFIKWSLFDRSYYGARYTQELNNRSPEDDFWLIYKTSSEVVDKFIIEHGDPDIKCIDRKFNTPEEAREYEHRILKINNVVNDERWLNQTDRPGPPILAGKTHPMFGKTHPPEIKKFLSDNMIGRFAGKNNPNWGKRGEECSWFGRKHTHEELQKMSNSMIGKNAGEKNGMFGLSGKNNPNFGRKHTNEFKQGRIGENNPHFKGWYITPWGNYSSVREIIENCSIKINGQTVSNWCKNNQKLITQPMILHSNYLTNDMLGKTFQEIGFDFIPKE